jgi:alanine dehydrogenase
MARGATYLITRTQVRAALNIEQALEAVESAFRAYGNGRVQMPPKSYLTFQKGDLRCMPGYLPEVGLAAVKNVNVHPQNVGLPSVMATVTVIDPESGFPLAIMDGTYLTAMRTGAAGGVAAKYLARDDVRVAGFIGAGRQAQTQLAALLLTRPGIEKVLVADASPGHAEVFARHCAEQHGRSASVGSPEEVVRGCDVLTTVTPACQPVVRAEWVQPGTHINAIGADAPGKQELDVAVLQNAKIVVDNWTQAAHGGEINVAVARGLLTHQAVHADIGQVVTGHKPGREGPKEVTVFDSTGLAIQDVACAAWVYRQVVEGASARGQFEAIDFMA